MLEANVHRVFHWSGQPNGTVVNNVGESAKARIVQATQTASQCQARQRVHHVAPQYDEWHPSFTPRL